MFVEKLFCFLSKIFKRLYIYRIYIYIIMKPKVVGDPTSKGSFTLERLCLGLNLSVTLLLGFDIIITLL